MKKAITVVAVGGVVAGLSAAAPRGGGAGVFAPLAVGQTVALTETPAGYRVGVVPGLELGHKVVEVGADHVALLDPAGVTETRIPICSVKTVVVTRLPGK